MVGVQRKCTKLKREVGRSGAGRQRQIKSLVFTSHTGVNYTVTQ